MQRFWARSYKDCFDTSDLPCTDVPWCNYSFSWPSEQTRQIVSLVPSSLHEVAELYHYNVGHGISIL